jgi:hypothetical protein
MSHKYLSIVGEGRIFAFLTTRVEKAGTLGKTGGNVPAEVLSGASPDNILGCTRTFVCARRGVLHPRREASASNLTDPWQPSMMRAVGRAPCRTFPFCSLSVFLFRDRAHQRLLVHFTVFLLVPCSVENYPVDFLLRGWVMFTPHLACSVRIPI